MAAEAAKEEPAVVGASAAAEASYPIPHLRHQAATTMSIQCSMRPPKMTALQTAAEAESAAVVVVAAAAAGFLWRFLKTAILRHSFLGGIYLILIKLLNENINILCVSSSILKSNKLLAELSAQSSCVFSYNAYIHIILYTPGAVCTNL